MDSLNNHIQEYKKQLSKGQIQKAYKGIMTFMSGLSTYLETSYSDYTASALYFGYMERFILLVCFLMTSGLLFSRSFN